MKTLIRRLIFWADSHLWFHVAMLTKRFDVPNTHHRVMMGIYCFAWAKFCGHGFKHAWLMGMIYWRSKRYAKTLILLAALMLTGCTNLNPGKIIGQLYKDGANNNSTIVLKVPTPGGLMELTRTNPGTNSTVQIDPKGVITIKRE